MADALIELLSTGDNDGDTNGYNLAFLNIKDPLQYSINMVKLLHIQILI